MNRKENKSTVYTKEERDAINKATSALEEATKKIEERTGVTAEQLMEGYYQEEEKAKKETTAVTKDISDAYNVIASIVANKTYWETQGKAVNISSIFNSQPATKTPGGVEKIQGIVNNGGNEPDKLQKIIEEAVEGRNRRQADNDTTSNQYKLYQAITEVPANPRAAIAKLESLLDSLPKEPEPTRQATQTKRF